MDNKEAEAAPTAPNVLRLPAELQLHIIQHLTFGELEHLRRTCRFYRAFISPAVVGRLFGTAHRLQAALLSTCRDCLRTEDPVASSPPTMLWADVASADWPLASRCVVCAFKARDLYVDEQITFADWTSAYVCRWCGMPVHVGRTSDYTSMQVNEFHVPCWDAYKRVHHRFLLLGLLSAGVAVLASASSMVLVPRNLKIVMPAVVSQGYVPRRVIVLTLFQDQSGVGPASVRDHVVSDGQVEDLSFCRRDRCRHRCHLDLVARRVWCNDAE
ncbi:hypothetical protein VDGD_07623 [Verticillium dahliae]|nr:hypothetical protein VDGD_07623 [Verticillium dahliae]